MAGIYSDCSTTKIITVVQRRDGPRQPCSDYNDDDDDVAILQIFSVTLWARQLLRSLFS